MCRLFGSRSLKPGGVAHELLRGSNALRHQSHEHPDGWGLAWYVGGEPQVARSIEPAHADEDFENVSQFVEAATVVAHIRKASVGRVAMENTHPFRHGPWLFAHNGTLPCWDRCAARLERRIDPGLRRAIEGDTDSERCFFLFLTLLSRRGPLERARFADAAEALRLTVAEVMRETAAERLRAKSPEPPPDASTTFLVTDGHLMLACRNGRTLQISAPEPDSAGQVHWFAVSSEDPLGDARAGGERAPWREVPEGVLVGVDPALRLHRLPLFG
jgi:glutamine amidotransferase